MDHIFASSVDVVHVRIENYVCYIEINDCIFHLLVNCGLKRVFDAVHP